MISQFQIQTQKELNWCWAAVAVTIKRYFEPQDTVTQCALASLVNGRDCCKDSDSCDQPKQLQEALDRVGVLKETSAGVQLDFDKVKENIDAGFPVCVRIGWFGPGSRGHFVIIRGYSMSQSDKWLDIADPFYLDSIVPYNEFKDAYLGVGQWTDTFLLKQPE